MNRVSVSTNVVASVIMLLTWNLPMASAQEREERAKQRPKEVEESVKARDPASKEATKELKKLPRFDQRRVLDEPVPREIILESPGVQSRVIRKESLLETQRPEDDFGKVFQRVEEGMLTGNIGAFSSFFASQVLVNIRGGESGYCSPSQTYYVLESFLKSRKVVSFQFTTVGESDSNPYATGSATLSTKGSRELAQVYVSLSLTEGRWVIAQINIY